MARLLSQRLSVAGAFRDLKRNLSTVGEAPRAWGVVVAGFSVLIFVLFIAQGQPERGIVAMFTSGTVVLVSALFWEHHQRAWFWLVSSVIGVVHLGLVFGIDWSFSKKPGLLLAGVFALDALAIFLVFSAIERWNER